MDVFISYSRKDKEFVHRLQEALVEHEREAWLDTKDIPPTAEWLQEIYAAIEKADSFVCVISPDVLGSEFCQLELAHAVKHHKRLIPVVRRDVDPKAVPDILARLNWIFCREGDDFSQSFEALLTAIATDLDHVRVHTRLLIKALEWEGRGREKSLLLRGIELKRSEEWLATSRDREPEPTPLQVQFLLASRQGETGRQRRTLGAVTLALMVTLGLTVATYFLYREAGSQKESALARGLAAQSELLRSQQPHLLDRSVLLAVESIRRRPTLEGSLALQRGLALLPKSLATMAVKEGLSEITVSPDGTWVAGWVHKSDMGPGKVWVWEAGTGRLVTSLPPEESEYLLVAFSPDSKRVITCTDEGSLRVTAVIDGRELSRSTLSLRGKKAAFSPDGNLIATGGKDHQVIVYDVKTGRELVRLPFSGYLVRLAFTPDSANLAVIYDNAMQLWEVPAGTSLGRFMDLEHHIQELAVSPDGQYLAAGTGQAEGTEETKVSVCHLPTRRVVAHLPRKGPCYALGFSQNGLLMTATSDGVAVWRPRDGQEVFRVKPPGSNEAALSPSGRWLAVGVNHAVQVYDLTTGREAKRLPHTEVSGIVFSPDSQWLFTHGKGGVVRWQIDGFEELIRLSHREAAWQTVDFGFSPGGKLLATSDPAEGLVHLWEISTGQRLYSLKRTVGSEGMPLKETKLGVDDVHGDPGVGSFSPDGKWLALPHRYLYRRQPEHKIFKMVGVYNTATGKLVSCITDLEDSARISFRIDSRALITTTGDNIQKVWGLATGKLLDTIPGLPVPPKVEGGLFSPDGKWFCSVGEDQVLRVWELGTGREVLQVGHAQTYLRSVFSHTGQYLATAVSRKKSGEGWTVLVYEVASGRQVTSVAKCLTDFKPTFDPSGKFLVVATEGNLVILLDLATGRELVRLKHEAEVLSSNFSVDGLWLATGSGDRTARIWELPNGREAARLEHPNSVTAVAFSPGGNRLATSCEDFQVRLWYWRTADLVTAACGRLLRNLSREEWREYLGDEPYRPTCPNLPAQEK